MEPPHSPVHDFKWVLGASIPRIVRIARAKYGLLFTIGIKFEPQRYGNTEQRFPFHQLTVDENVTWQILKYVRSLFFVRFGKDLVSTEI